MEAHDITVRLPESLFRRLRFRAEQANRSVEAEVLEAVASSVPEVEGLTDDLAEPLSALRLLDDTSLWRAARNRLPRRMAGELERLNLKQQREGLTELERQQAALLLRRYEFSMLVRAEAARLLKERGHDISVLFAS